MASGRSGESKQGLVIALVFFVLATIGLGVATYYGFNEQDKLRKDVADAKGNVTKITKDRDWYKFQAQLYLAYMGQTQAVDLTDLATAKGQFDTGSLSGDNKEEITKLIKDTLDRKMPWDNTQNRPKQSYESLLQQEKHRCEDLENLSKSYFAAKEAAEASAKKASDELKAERNSFETKLAELNEKAKADRSGDLKQIADQRAEMDRLSAKNGEIAQSASDEKKKLDDVLNKQQVIVKGLKEANAAQKLKIDEYRNKGNDIAPRDWQTDWKIVSINRTGELPFINLGSADHVQPQLTFSIHSLSPDGRPVPESKGSLEVVNVLKPHLSQARILSVKDRNKDPILKGDILYNPSWNPSIKTHIALAGIVDLTGDGRDSTYELVRNLEKHNVVVDAYVDPRDNTIKGPGITAQTDYLILGNSAPEQRSEHLREADTKRETESSKLLSQAQSNGVQVVTLLKYLDMIGYRLPRSLTEPSTRYRPSAVPPPTESTVPAPTSSKKEEKPAMDEKPQQ